MKFKNKGIYSIENEVRLDTEKQNEPKMKVERKEGEPTSAFKGASWAALIVGVAAYLIGLYNAGSIVLSEKGFYGYIKVY